MRGPIAVTILALFGLSFFSSSVRATENDLYDFLWLDPDKAVYVLQNKVYPKKKSIYFDAGALKGLSSTYQTTYGYNLKAGYFFAEEFGFEIFHTRYQHTNNDTYESIRRISGTEPFMRRLTTASGGVLVWSPFYGKINTFNKIIYFDWSFGLGAAQINAESNINTVANPNLPNNFTKESYAGGVAKTDLRFYVTKKIHVNLELRGLFYQAESPLNRGQKNTKTTTDAILSLGIAF